MVKQLQFKRLFWLALLLVFGFAGLGLRLGSLQVLRHEELSNLAQRNTQRTFCLEPRRGDILDAKGNLLATSVFVKTVAADWNFIGPRVREVAHAVAPVLGLDEAGLVQFLESRRLRKNSKGETVTNAFVVLKNKVSAETWERLQQTMANLSFGVEEKKLPKAEQAFYRNLRAKAIVADPRSDQIRVYPNQQLAAHVLGYVGLADRIVNSNRVSELAGAEGIERVLNSKLSGVSGWRVTETDRRNRELLTLREQEVAPHDGLNVVLTIDSMIQHIAETALAEAVQKHSPISASAIVVRPRTGEILAMATLPNYDPNNPGAAAAAARRNRVISDLAEPGSTFKVVVVSGALNDGLVRLTDKFDCERGKFAFAGRVLHDHDPYDTLTVENIITKSSNIGSAKIGILLQEARLHQYIRDFGFGTATGIPLSGEVRGIVNPVKSWSKVSIAQIPMGHGVAVTPLQMIMAMSAIANDGVLMRPLLVDRLEDETGHAVAQYPPQRVRQVISAAAAHEMVKALKTVVTPDGTAAKAALDYYTVAGKTGTAQKVINGQYANDKFFSSFIGFFPAENPELCISVVLDEPKGGHYGGQVAAPAFKQIAERAANYLNIRPDRETEAKPGKPTNLTKKS